MRAILLGPLLRGAHLNALWKSVEITEADFKIGVDGGSAIWFERGLKPDFCIGDWDSLESMEKSKSKTQALLGKLARCPHLTLPQDKDRSDLFFAVIAAIEAGAKEILCIGVSGGRPDHHLAMLTDLSMFSSGLFGKLNRIEVLGLEAQYFFLSSKTSVWKGTLRKGQIVSLFSMSEISTGITLDGFKYSLKNESLTPSSRGLSNVVVSQKKACKIQLKSGRLLFVVVPT